MSSAKEAGITDPTAWRKEAKRRAELAQVEAEKTKKAEAEAELAKAEDQKVKVEACERDLQCVGDSKSAEATVACQPHVERLAKNDFQWTDHWDEPKFSRFRWADQTNGIITYLGDKIKFQNGFGAWVRSIYECDYNFRSKSIADVRAREGQFPPD